jgi:GH15 family glucan-1,4-alpha-glucosidase
MKAERFPPQTIRQYALLADGERGALVGPRGDVAFLCAPQWHDDAVFSSLLGGRGHYAVTPADDHFVWGGHYEQDSLIWTSRWVTENGEVECLEALAAPGDPHSLVLLRRIVARRGDASLRLLLEPRAGFGQHPMTAESDQGTWIGRTGDLHFRWQGGRNVADHDGSLVGEISLPEGEFHDLVLEIADHPLPRVPPDPVDTWERTRSYWDSRQPDLAPTLATADVRHSYAVLRGLTSHHTDGMVGAATTSLPERANSDRNYDYRYAWIRDQCYAGLAAIKVGARDLARHAVSFVSARLLEDGPALRPAYRVDGGPVPDESALPVPGYPGGGARRGNWVNGQFQLDAFGEALQLFAAAEQAEMLDGEHWKAALAAVDAIDQRHADAGAGIWELDDRHWAHSRLSCAAGLRRLASARPASSQARAWSDLADAIVADVDHGCLHPSGRWQRSPEDERVDSSLLVPGLRGAVPPHDARHVGTWEAVKRELTDDLYVYRFRHDDRPLAEAEGAFLLSSFHLALVAHQQGRMVEAVRWFERGRAALGPPGLFTEEYDVVQRQLRGNLPQAFVHALFMEAAHTLADIDVDID